MYSDSKNHVRVVHPPVEPAYSSKLVLSLDAHSLWLERLELSEAPSRVVGISSLIAQPLRLHLSKEDRRTLAAFLLDPDTTPEMMTSFVGSLTGYTPI